MLSVINKWNHICYIISCELVYTLVILFCLNNRDSEYPYFFSSCYICLPSYLLAEPLAHSVSFLSLQMITWKVIVTRDDEVAIEIICIIGEDWGHPYVFIYVV